LSGSSGNNLVGQNLKLRALANNGGPGQAVAFEFDSPLHNAGCNTAGLTVDERGSAASAAPVKPSTSGPSNSTPP
jgi:hypothetical protein